MPKVAIVGAGPSGLALALLLQQKNVDFTVFERRPRPTPQELAAPSGMLDLHEDSGLAAIEACGLTSEFLKHTGDCSQAMTVMNKEGATLYGDGGDNDGIGGYRPEIPRHALLSLFLDKIEPARIHWQHKLKTATKASTKNTVQLDFGDTVHEFDFVVGADGAWSKVRSLLAPNADPPAYSGLQYATVTVRDVSKRFPHLMNKIGTGMFFVLSNGIAAIGHRGVHDTECLYLTVQGASDKGGLVGLSAADLKDRMLSDPDYFGAWWPEAKKLITAGFDDEIAAEKATGTRVVNVKPMYKLPAGFGWATDVRATLVGDAAHLMLPYAGEGVNLALWDVLELSGILATAAQASGEDFHGAIKAPLAQFEASMVARAREKAEDTDKNSVLMFGDDAANKMATLIKSFGPPEETAE